MFGTVRKHSTWLWMVIIVAIIISFVVFFTPNAGSGFGQSSASVDIYGQSYGQEDFNKAGTEVRLYFMLQNQQPPTGDTLNDAAMQRLLVKSLIAQYGIKVGNDAVAEWIRERLMGGTGSIAGMTYQQYIDSFLQPSGMSQEMFEDFVRTEVGSEILRESVGSTGVLITPAEVEAAYIADNKKTPVELAYVANSNYVAKVVLSPDELTKFYSNRVAAYRTPERIKVSYVRLATSNFVAEAEAQLNENGVLDQTVDAEYERRKAAYEGVEPDEVKKQVRQELIDERALEVAQRKAYEFVNEYFESEPKTTAAMDAAARKIGLSAQQAPPFGRSEIPEGMSVGFDFVQAAWELSEDEPYSIPVLTPSGYYAISYEGKVPGAVQPYADVKDRVEEEFKKDRARTLAQEAADAFYAASTNAVAAGQSFTNLAKLSGFATASLPELSNRSAMDAASLDLPVQAGQVARMVENQDDNSVSRPQFAGDGLLIIKVGERQEPTPEELADGVKEYIPLIQSARSREVFGEWLNRQYQASGLQTQLRAP